MSAAIRESEINLFWRLCHDLQVGEQNLDSEMLFEALDDLDALIHLHTSNPKLRARAAAILWSWGKTPSTWETEEWA